jgi:hypothetical protein
MADGIPLTIVSDLNELRWRQTDEDNRYEMIEGKRVMKTRPEGTVWFAWTGHEEGRELAAALRNSPAKIDAQLDFVGDAFGVSVPPSQVPALAEAGVKFAREALQNPGLAEYDPQGRARGVR